MTETASDAVLEQVAGQTYHQQMLNAYWQAGEQITLNALVMLCLAARRFDGRVKYVILDDSDQGDWQCVAGLCAALPMRPGDYSEVSDLDEDDEFDDEGWASSVDDRTEHSWGPYLVLSEAMPHWKFLDVDRVLAEVHLPWRPVTQVTQKFTDLPTGFHDNKRERDANTVGGA
jgi:hypothetical protein